MASEVDICNIALRRIGAERITSLAEQTKRAKLCNDAYAIVRDAMLRSHPWNFATFRVELAKTATTPEFGYSSEFQLPNDYLRIMIIEDGDLIDYDFRIEQDKLLIDENALKIEYISKITNTGLFDPNFVTALGLAIAEELSYAMVQSNSLKEQIREDARIALASARLIDAQSNGVRQLITNEWTQERL